MYPVLHSKYELLQMNKNPNLGINWITHIETIKENETAYIYPTWDTGFHGHIYIALPASLLITPEVKKKYNLI